MVPLKPDSTVHVLVSSVAMSKAKLEVGRRKSVVPNNTDLTFIPSTTNVTPIVHHLEPHILFTYS